MKKKLLTILMLTLTIVCMNALVSKSIFLFSQNGIAQALEAEVKRIEPYVFYDTNFGNGTPEQLLSCKKNSYLVTSDCLYKYDFYEEQWKVLKSGKPEATTMGTIKGLNYRGLNDGLIVKDYFKIVSDINNDGKEVYELNVDINGEYQWEKLLENGKFLKATEGNIDNYVVYNYYEEAINRLETKVNNTEFYLRNNKLYSLNSSKASQLIRDYSEEKPKSLNIIKFGEEVFVYGGSSGVERITSTNIGNEILYSVLAIGQKEFLSGKNIVDISSPDEGHNIFTISEEGKVYRTILADTWVYEDSLETDILTEIRYEINNKNKVSEIKVNDNLYKIVSSEEWGKSYITVNDKVLSSTIRDSYQYPDTISRFGEGDLYLYIWSNTTEPIRIDTRDNSVVNMGQSALFSDKMYKYEKLIRDKNGNIYMEKDDGKYFRYIEKNKFYSLDLKADDITIVNDLCYAINEKGLYCYESNGAWNLVVNEGGKEKLININNSLYALAEGVLYKFVEGSSWEKLDGKINYGLSDVYFVNLKNRKVYFVAEDKDEKFITTYDYDKNQWSKTKNLPKGINFQSIAVEGNSIYVGTQNISEGLAYIYKNGDWTSIMPQLSIDKSNTDIKSKLIMVEDNVYFQTGFKSKEHRETWIIKDGNVTKVEDIEELDWVNKSLEKEKYKYSNSENIIYTIKDGMVCRKVI